MVLKSVPFMNYARNYTSSQETVSFTIHVVLSAISALLIDYKFLSKKSAIFGQLEKNGHFLLYLTFTTL